MNFEQYPYILAIRKVPSLKNLNLQDFFKTNDFQLSFDPDGYYYEKFGKVSGRYHFATPEELKELSQKFVWPTHSQCPFVGPVLGYCLLEPWIQDSFWYLMELALGRGCGFLVNLQNNTCFDIVAQKEFSLMEIVGRHGFKEGALILMETDEYQKYIHDSIKNSVASLGLKPYSYHGGDHQYILDAFEGEGQHGASHWEKFESHQNSIRLKLWIANMEGFREFQKASLGHPS